MSESNDGHAIDEWPEVLGPQSDDEPMHYDMLIDDAGTVTLIGPAPGMKYRYEREVFESLVDRGEWVLARVDHDRELYETPDGTIHW